jgi:hypothetical protein
MIRNISAEEKDHLIEEGYIEENQGKYDRNTRNI